MADGAMGGRFLHATRRFFRRPDMQIGSAQGLGHPAVPEVGVRHRVPVPGSSGPGHGLELGGLLRSDGLDGLDEGHPAPVRGGCSARSFFAGGRGAESYPNQGSGFDLPLHRRFRSHDFWDRGGSRAVQVPGQRNETKSARRGFPSPQGGRRGGLENVGKSYRGSGDQTSR